MSDQLVLDHGNFTKDLISSIEQNLHRHEMTQDRKYDQSSAASKSVKDQDQGYEYRNTTLEDTARSVFVKKPAESEVSNRFMYYLELVLVSTGYK